MNLREFRRWNDYTAIGMSILFNTLIMFLACTERNMTLRSYSRMIVLSCIIDYAFCFGAVVSVIVSFFSYTSKISLVTPVVFRTP